MENQEARLVRQQLKHLRKAELKLLRYKPDRRSGFGGAFIRSKVPEKLLTMLESAFEKGFLYIFEKGTPLIERSGNLSGVKEKSAYHHTVIKRQISKQSIKNFDVSASNKSWANKGISTVEGAALGVFGIGLPDIPVFLGMVFKSIYETAASYGFNYSSREERAYILSIIRVAATKDSARIMESEQCDQIGEMIDAGYGSEVTLPPEEIKKTSNLLASSMLVAKFIQGITLVGTIGGGFNYYWIHRITKIAAMKYKKRFLQRLGDSRP
jgi:hypothetical protein